MSVTDVCRLCSNTKCLSYVFEKRTDVPPNMDMKQIVYITTGIEIHEKDIVSQKLCSRCCQLTLKMFNFRQDALRHDRELKERCGQILKETCMKIPNTNVTIKKEMTAPTIKNGKTAVKKSEPDGIHPSIAELFGSYPNLKIPSACLKSHISPFVTLTLGDVEEFFKLRKMDMNKFICPSPSKYPAKVARKRITQIIDNKPHIDPPKIINKSIDNKVSSVTETTKPIPKFTEKKFIKEKKTLEIHDNLKRKHSEKNEDKIPPQKIRKKLSESDTHSKHNKKPISVEFKTQSNHNKKPTTAESEKLSPDDRPSVSNMDSSNMLSVLGKSVPLFTCDICNSVQYSNKELKRHRNKHLVCQFCKTRFRTIISKTNHVEITCVVKKCMNNLPTIKLKKIDLNKKARRRYPEAFRSFPPLPGVDYYEKRHNANNKTGDDRASKKHITAHSLGIIEILSDEDDGPPENLRGRQVSVTSDKPTQSKANSVFQNENAKVPAYPTPPNSREDVSSPVKHLVAQEENIVYSTVSIVRPDIKVKNSNLLNLVDHSASDVKIINGLLTLIKPTEKTTTEAMVQTDIPTNKDIKVNPSDMTCELKYLKEHLKVYKIPVVIKPGSFNVHYSYHTENKPKKNLCYWNDLPKIDLPKNFTNGINVRNNLHFGAQNETITNKFSLQSNPVIVAVTGSLPQSQVIPKSIPSTAPILTTNSSIAPIIPSTPVIASASVSLPTNNSLLTDTSSVICTNTSSLPSSSTTLSSLQTSTTKPTNVISSTSVLPPATNSCSTLDAPVVVSNDVSNSVGVLPPAISSFTTSNDAPVSDNLPCSSTSLINTSSNSTILKSLNTSPVCNMPSSTSIPSSNSYSLLDAPAIISGSVPGGSSYATLNAPSVSSSTSVLPVHNTYNMPPPAVSNPVFNSNCTDYSRLANNNLNCSTSTALVAVTESPINTPIRVKNVWELQ